MFREFVLWMKLISTTQCGLTEIKQNAVQFACVTAYDSISIYFYSSIFAGAGGVELLTPRLYNAGTQEATEDLGEVSGVDATCIRGCVLGTPG